MLKMDERYPIDRIKQFASQYGEIPPVIIVNLESKFSKKESIDFYYGLLTAYSGLYASIISTLVKGTTADIEIQCTVAFISKIIVDRLN